MPSAPDPAPPPPKPRKRWLPRLRFSLRTLVIGVLLIGSAGGLWWRLEPWILAKTLVGHNSEVISAGFSSDSNCIVTGSMDCTARIWNLTNGKCQSILIGHMRRVSPVAFSGDNR